ncbi:DNA-binding transcriptional regulator, XRE-family HTH domain [Spirosomataceae bacterium TFI 002]|nr:DNA-binding transcriptional regulator, XRE-family HTH domain [Spirosomataceae bacterium TFI 002]
MSVLAENIKRIRKNSKLTQLQFGEKYGLSRENVSSYEDARAKPQLEVLIAIAKDEGITVESLFNDKIEKKQVEEAEVINSKLETEQNAIEGHKPATSQVEKQYFPSSLFDSQAEIVTTKEQKLINDDQGFSNTQVEAKESDDEYLGMQSVALVKNNKAYQENHNNPAWLAKLPHMHIPLYQKADYRAFEDKDSWFVCKQMNNWFDIADGSHCFVLAINNGLLYRKVYNEIKLKGEFLLSSFKEGEPVIQLSLRDTIEVWEVVAQINYGKPVTSPSFNKLEGLIEDLKLEIFRLSM